MNHVTQKCPNCGSPVEVEIALSSNVGLNEPKPLKYETLIRDADGQLSERPIRAVLAFMRHIGPGRYGAGALYTRYCQWRHEAEAPALKSASFGRAMGWAGGERFRSATERGWVIPPNIDTLDPVLPYIKSRRSERALMSNLVADSQQYSIDLEKPTPPAEDAPAPTPVQATRLTPEGWVPFSERF